MWKASKEMWQRWGKQITGNMETHRGNRREWRPSSSGSENEHTEHRGAAQEIWGLRGRRGRQISHLTAPQWSAMALVSHTEDNALAHCNNKTHLAGKFLPISNLKDANQTLPSRDYFCRLQDNSAAKGNGYSVQLGIASSQDHRVKSCGPRVPPHKARESPGPATLQ